MTEDKRFRIDGHMLEDTIENKFYTKDKGYVHIVNVLYKQIGKILEELEKMTEKRFTIFGEWHKDNVIDEIRDNTGEFVTIGRCVDLLNENEQLKQQNKKLKEELEWCRITIDGLKGDV